ncbi:L-threonylcarbamoyladenylate synthase [Legionella israelensis]|uniref:L-threonylcarbamoyladenylate synthase n=1 Tax=Legionella israelensis TaxID=454 RepID=UPI00163DCCEB|nr:L-threonylcarbamoyladenylate synthase [Legionella israelensis]
MTIITTNLQYAIDDLQRGKPVAIPTETVYGLAALINNETGISSVFAMKKRPLNHPLIVHVGKNEDLSKWVAYLPDYAKTLMQVFWPGPLTLVFRAKEDRFHPLITAGQNTVAIRSPGHPLTQELLKLLEVPLVAPSANPFGKVSPTTAVHVQQSFPDQSLTILNGGRCQVGIESTIIDATSEEGYAILRHGIINEKELMKVSSKLIDQPDNTIRVPGKLASHYQPEKTLYYFSNKETLNAFCQQHSERVFVIAQSKPSTVSHAHFSSFPHLPQKAAYELYYQLRQADLSDTSCIAIELPPDSVEWKGVVERIRKAGVPFSVEEG